MIRKPPYGIGYWEWYAAPVVDRVWSWVRAPWYCRECRRRLTGSHKMQCSKGR